MSNHRGRPASTEKPGRDRLLQAARVEFGERGYGATTVDHLVKAAGVNPPTLYHHFGGKAGLFVAAARTGYSDVMKAFRQAVPNPEELQFDEAVGAILDVSVAMMERNDGLAKLFQVIQFEVPRNADLESELLPTLRELGSFFDGIARRAPSSLASNRAEQRSLSRALIAIITGFNGQGLLLRRNSEFRGLVNQMRALLQHN